MDISKNDNKGFSVSLILITGYLFIQVLSNLTVSKQIPIAHGIEIPFGSLLYALSYTWIDLVNDYFGKHKSRLLVIVAICSNIIMIFWFELYILLPGTEHWNHHPENQKAIEFVLGGVWRIYLSSILTNFVCENVDISLFHFLKYGYPNQPRWKRSLLSNTVSAPLDAILFPTLAFIGILPLNVLFSIILSSILYKLIISYISIPILYLVKARNTL